MEKELCANGCGFFGSPENKNFCSKCYKDYLKLKGNIITKPDDESSKINVPDESSTNDVANDVVDVSMTMKKKKNRCKSCNKKVGIIAGFECRCGEVFCGRHRYPELHACKVNFKDIGRQDLAKQNPLCIRDKLGNRV